jgi:hypothetical protein
VCSATSAEISGALGLILPAAQPTAKPASITVNNNMNNGFKNFKVISHAIFNQSNVYMINLLALFSKLSL